ncbi:hypothetical protein CSAL01_00931 [Colletotrichum salicis]|uniref:Uncharacterized protein n=1 Tax=Colletotrichum salicis TaxID=1209931 RepID=A0A135USD5_9PEZI|nr:hypothetical protein CSAL01_00931 [Colletotrichum salicis]
MILRLYEEMTVPSVDDRPYGHILDTNKFTLPESPEGPNYSLCRTCLLVAIRQEIFISFVARTPPPRLAHRCGITRTLEPTSDFDWAWRIITFTEDVLTFAYGPDAWSTASWEDLRTYLHQWMEKRPASFNPLWQAGSDRETFSEVIFANDFHTQHLIVDNSLARWPGGHLFRDPAEQEKLLDILAKSEAYMGWSLLRQEERLKAFWERNAE